MRRFHPEHPDSKTSLATWYKVTSGASEVEDVRHVDLIRSLMLEHGLRQKDLVDVFKTESIVSEVLAGKRVLNKSQIEGLAAKFSVSPSVFFPSRKLAAR